jgi:hypothetical protein
MRSPYYSLILFSLVFMLEFHISLGAQSAKNCLSGKWTFTPMFFGRNDLNHEGTCLFMIMDFN